jgi:methyltransferase (TIGR00027 family)
MTGEGVEIFRRFADLTMPNRSNAARARIFDDWLGAALKEHPGQLVVVPGAGFDTRAFRLNGGQWVELDQEALMARKAEVLPAEECPNALTRLAIDFGRDSLADRLAPWRGGARAIVVLEGVSMYLPQASLRQTLATLREIFPGHLLFMDLMTRNFSERQGREIRRRIAELGGDFAPLVDDPVAGVLGCGYDLIERVSTVGRAAELGAVPIPRFLLATLLRGLRDGYMCCRFAAR